jgi:hypothetical protein
MSLHEQSCSRFSFRIERNGAAKNFKEGSVQPVLPEMFWFKQPFDHCICGTFPTMLQQLLCCTILSKLLALVASFSQSIACWSSATDNAFSHGLMLHVPGGIFYAKQSCALAKFGRHSMWFVHRWLKSLVMSLLDSTT